MQGMYMCLTLLILYNRSTSGECERPDAQPENSSLVPSYPRAQVQVVREVFCLHTMLILLSPTCGYNFLINVVTIFSQHCHVMRVEQNEDIRSTCSVKHVLMCVSTNQRLRETHCPTRQLKIFSDPWQSA